MSNGGSLRISTASNAVSGATSVPRSSYQGLACRGTRRRCTLARTTPPNAISSTVHAKIAWPRPAASRIMATVESLYALSFGSGSTMKSRASAIA